MEITCSFCNTSFVLPDDRLPEAKKFKLNCPKCREPLLIEQKSTQNQVLIPENFPHDATVSLLHISDNQLEQRVIAYLKEKNIYISEAKNITVALEKIKINYYQILILEEGYTSQAILDAIKRWDGLRRRDINIIQVNSDAQTMHEHEAFLRGVNFVISRNDAKKIEYFLEIIFKEYENYKNLWKTAEKKASLVR